MKRWVVAGIAVGHALRLGFVEAVADATKAAVKSLQSWIEGAWQWHRSRMITDPSYPLALLAIGKAVVRICVPQAALATALIAVVAEVVVGSQPWLSDEEWYLED